MTKKDADASVLVKFAYTRYAEGNPIAIERESGLGVCYHDYDAAGHRTLLRHSSPCPGASATPARTAAA